MIGMFFSDVHVNPKNYERVFRELDLNIIETLDSIIGTENHPDCVILGGDFFDYVMPFNHPAVIASVSWFTKLAKKLKDANIIFIVVKGTKTHDANQLSNINAALSPVFDNFFYFDTFGEKTFTFQNEVYNLLFLPEEYPSDYKEYYKDILVKKNYYHLIALHGTVSSKAWANQVLVTERPYPGHVVWNEDELFSLLTSNGGIVAGHIHTHSIIKGLLTYNGSFSRENQGEPEPKGFTVFSIQKDIPPEFIFLENETAPIYKKLFLDTFDVNDPLGSVKYLEDLLSTSENQIYIRLEFTAKFKDENTNFINTLQNYFNSEKRIQFFSYAKEKVAITFKGTDTDEDRNRIVTELESNQHLTLKEVLHNNVTENDTVKTYREVINNKDNLPLAIQSFIKIKFDKDIPLDVIGKLISNEELTEV